jgi:hypothetical protein
MDNLPDEMSDHQNTAVLAYPVPPNSQSLYQLALYPITLKVILSLSLSLSLSKKQDIFIYIFINYIH